MDQDSDLKRQYLKDNLSKQGYNEEDFIKFMGNLKSNIKSTRPIYRIMDNGGIKGSYYY